MYNKEAVDKQIKKDPRIKSSEAKLIHRLLKGRVTNPDIIKDPSKPAFIVRTKQWDLKENVLLISRRWFTSDMISILNLGSSLELYGAIIFVKMWQIPFSIQL